MPYKKPVEKKPHRNDEIWKFLSDEYPGDAEPYSFDVFMLLDSSELQKLWDEYKDEILESYISKFPGKRPSLWWTFSGPMIEVNWPGVIYIVEPRQKISGYFYLPWTDGKSLKPWYYKGIPVASGLFDMYDFEKDMAYFEAEATYLKRHELLTEDEERRLTDGDFKPQGADEILFERSKIKPY